MGAEQSSPAAGRAASPARGRAASPGRPRRAPLSPTNKNATVVDVDSPPPRITKASVSEISGLSADASAAAAERVEARRAAEKARIKAERQGPSIRPHPNYQALRGLTSPGAKPLRADWDATSLRRDHAMSSPPPADAPRASGGGGVTPMRWNSVHARTSSPRQTPRPSPRPASPRSGREEADDRAREAEAAAAEAEERAAELELELDGAHKDAASALGLLLSVAALLLVVLTGCTLQASASHDGWAGEAAANVVREDDDDLDDGDDYDNPRSGGRRPEPRRGDLRSGRDDRKYM